MLLDRTQSAWLRRLSLSLCLLAVAFTAAGHARGAVDWCEVAIAMWRTRQAPGLPCLDVNHMIDLIGASMTTDVADPMIACHDPAALREWLTSTSIRIFRPRHRRRTGWRQTSSPTELQSAIDWAAMLAATRRARQARSFEHTEPSTPSSAGRNCRSPQRPQSRQQRYHVMVATPCSSPGDRRTAGRASSRSDQWAAHHRSGSCTPAQ